VRGVLMIGLAGCRVVFDVTPTPDAPSDAPGDADTRSLPCQLAGAKLCLAFEDDLLDLEAIDESGEGNDASLENVLPTMRNGHQAVAIGATSRIKIKNVGTLHFPGPLSFDGFFRWAGTGDGIQVMLDSFMEYNAGFTNNGGIGCTFVFDPVEGQAGAILLAVGGVVVVDTWHHLACVYDPTVGAQMYFDGLLVSSNTTDINRTLVTTGDGRVRAGSFNNDGGRIIGEIDDVRIFDRVLSDDEIRETFIAE
jgi:hypothetical protein